MNDPHVETLAYRLEDTHSSFEGVQEVRVDNAARRGGRGHDVTDHENGQPETTARAC